MSGEGSSTHKVSTEEMLLGMGLIVASQVIRGLQDQGMGVGKTATL